MDVDCAGPNCFMDGASVGVLSTDVNAFAPAYGTTVGWDFATGIGTVNAANLVSNWPAAAPPQGSFTLSASGNANVVQGTTSTAVTITVNPQNGFAGNVAFSATGMPNGVTANFVPASSTTGSSLTFTATPGTTLGTFNITVKGVSGGLNNTTTLSLTVTAPPNFSMSAAPNSLSLTRGNKSSTTITITPLNGFTGYVTLAASGLRSGTTATFSPNPTNTGSSKLTFTAGSNATTGTFNVTIYGKSGGLSHSTTVSVTVHR